VCNAGIQVVKGVQRTRDNFELTFGTNHLGHFLLIQLLLDHLAKPARIVLVSSQVHQGPARSMGFPAPRWEHPLALGDPDRSRLGASSKTGRIRYATSKLASIYTAYELARRLDGRPITVNAFDPGPMPETGPDRDWPQWTRGIYHRVAPVLIRVPRHHGRRQHGAGECAKPRNAEHATDHPQGQFGSESLDELRPLLGEDADDDVVHMALDPVARGADRACAETPCRS
jgi:protochlorophyllide reductase